MQNIIYYFSSTGNSLDVARTISQNLSDCEFLSISKVMSTPQDKKVDILGIVFPVYMWGLPLIVKTFLENLKNVKAKYVFLCATCGGMGGAILKDAEKILGSNNLIVDAGFFVKSIDNYLPFFKIPDDNKINEIVSKSHNELKVIIKKIKSYENIPVKNHKGLLGFLFSKILYKMCISQAYKMSSNFHINENCNSCGICMKVCPVNNIEFQEDKPKWLDHCEHCLGCLHWCPKECIEYKKATIGKKRYHNPNVKVSDFF